MNYNQQLSARHNSYRVPALLAGIVSPVLDQKVIRVSEHSRSSREIDSVFSQIAAAL